MFLDELNIKGLLNGGKKENSVIKHDNQQLEKVTYSKWAHAYVFKANYTVSLKPVVFPLLMCIHRRCVLCVPRASPVIALWLGVISGNNRWLTVFNVFLISREKREIWWCVGVHETLEAFMSGSWRCVCIICVSGHYVRLSLPYLCAWLTCTLIGWWNISMLTK